MKIVLTDLAYQDLADIQDHYRLEGVESVGVRQVSEILDRIDNLNDHPQLGRVVPEYGLASIREIIHPPYRIVYLIQAEELQVIRIWRSERLLKLM